MSKKTIVFEHESKASGVLTPWSTTGKSRFKDQCIDPEFADRRFKFPLGDTWFRIVPALKDSSFGWLLGLHCNNTPNGRFVHTKSLIPGARTAFDHAYAYLKEHQPEALFSRNNKDGARLLTSPMCLFWMITEVDNKPVFRLIQASGYDGSRGGAAGLGHRILQLTQERDEAGNLVCDPTDPLTGPMVCVTKSQAGGAKYPSYSLRIGREPKPINELLEQMDSSEIKAIEPLESTTHILELDSEWDLLEEILDKDLVAKIKESVTTK